MKQVFLILFICCYTFTNTVAQKPASAEKQTPKEDKPGASSGTLNSDSQVLTTGQVTIKGQRVPYKATVGTIPVWDEEGKPVVQYLS